MEMLNVVISEVNVNDWAQQKTSFSVFKGDILSKNPFFLFLEACFRVSEVKNCKKNLESSWFNEPILIFISKVDSTSSAKPRVHVGSLRVLRLPPAVQKHAR